MKNIVIGIFAHPDDEAFLPSGSFITWVNEGADLHLICATKGENGQNQNNFADLGTERCKEWKQAGKRMGAASQTQLGFPDGGLNNNLFQELVTATTASINQIVSRYTDQVNVRFVTYETCGITGHLDHIAMSYVTTFIYEQLRGGLPQSELLYACACEAVSPKADTSFVFMPKGHAHDEIDLTVDVSSVLEQKKQVMRAHASQRADADGIMHTLGPNLAFEHFNYFKD